MAFVIGLIIFMSGFISAGPIPGNDGAGYNCSEITASKGGEEACKATGWCVWSTTSNACVYDKCLKTVADNAEVVAGLCDPADGSTSGWGCTLYYLTDAHNCDTGADIQTNRYCRTNVASNLRNPMTDCFYNDLKAWDADHTAHLCPSPKCALNTSQTDWGQYCYTTDAPACDEFYGKGQYDLFCQCLAAGPTNYCDLFPGCQNSSNSCIVDPCYTYTKSGLDGCIGVPGTLDNVCGPKAVNKPTADKSTGTKGNICVTKSRSDINTCYYLQDTSTESKFPEYPECSTLVEKEDLCTSSVLFKDNGDADTGSNCAFTPIAGHYFYAPDGHYCNDGKRKNGVPSPTGAAVSIGVPSLIVAFLAAVALLI